ncbi:MAG: DUF2232 domain-containing protein, partial [Gemmatimonadales bacterium]
VWSSGAAAAPRLAGATSAYIVLVTAAFVTVVLLWPASVLRQATRATLAGGAATGLLVHAFWGMEGWRALAWEATRETGLDMRFILERTPDAASLYEPVVRFVSVTTPGVLALQTLAGLALAWRWHLALATPPLGAPAAPFREFRLSDGWVWGVVVWLALLVLPLAGRSADVIEIAGANVGFVLTALYVLRGAAIVAAFADVFGISAAALTIAAAAAAALALPLLFLIPGLGTLGITDTWYEYRRRLSRWTRGSGGSDGSARPTNAP